MNEMDNSEESINSLEAASSAAVIKGQVKQELQYLLW